MDDVSETHVEESHAWEKNDPKTSFFQHFLGLDSSFSLMMMERFDAMQGEGIRHRFHDLSR